MNSILELIHKDRGQPYEVDVKEIVGKVKKGLSDNFLEANAELTLRLDIKYINANVPYLESIIYNLMSSSIKYRSENRKLNILISSYNENSFVVVEISDNGMGVNHSKFGGKILDCIKDFMIT